MYSFYFIFLNDEYLSFSLKAKNFITEISNVINENVKAKKKTGFDHKIINKIINKMNRKVSNISFDA